MESFLHSHVRGVSMFGLHICVSVRDFLQIQSGLSHLSSYLQGSGCHTISHGWLLLLLAWHLPPINPGDRRWTFYLILICFLAARCLRAPHLSCNFVWHCALLPEVNQEYLSQSSIFYWFPYNLSKSCEAVILTQPSISYYASWDNQMFRLHSR